MSTAASVLPSAPEAHPSTHCFCVVGRAEPSLMPRVVELFAKRGLVPARWHSTLDGPRRDSLVIDLQVEGLEGAAAGLIAECLRQVVSVETVMLSVKGYA